MATAWKVLGKAKRNIGRGSFTLHTGTYRMALCRASASALLSQSKSVGGISVWASISGTEISARGGYAANGRSVPNIKWSTGATQSTLKFYYTATGIIFTASNSALNNIKYAVIRNSTGAGTGLLLCYSQLSTSPFTISSPNTLTILPAANGVFSLV